MAHKNGLEPDAVQANTVLRGASDNTYTELKFAGTGSYGVVYKAVSSRDGSRVAIKFLQLEKATRYMEGELLNHSSLYHPHVIGFREVFLTRNYVCLVMDYAPGGTLKRFIQLQPGGRLPEGGGRGSARWFFHQLIIGLDYCHKKGVFNRDVKLDNTLLMDNHVLKIADFGFSKSQADSNPKTHVGTPLYMAPEVMTASSNPNKPYNGQLADIWSAGVMLYFMLVGKYPFLPMADEDGYMHHSLSLLNQMRANAAEYPPELVSPLARDLLTQMLRPRPSERITMAGVMQHAWFRTELPDQVDIMNDSWLLQPLPPGRMTPEETTAVLQEAKSRLEAQTAQAGLSGDADPTSVNGMLDDEFIDEVIEEDAMEHQAERDGDADGMSSGMQRTLIGIGPH